MLTKYIIKWVKTNNNVIYDLGMSLHLQHVYLLYKLDIEFIPKASSMRFGTIFQKLQFAQYCAMNELKAGGSGRGKH